jgi:peptidoglycan/LPS O-acetylase OafA/YrhL
LSLSIEEQIYLIWPALLALLLSRLRWDGAKLLAVTAALTLLSWLMVVGLALAGAPDRIASNATPTRAVELLIGGLLAIYLATPSLSGPLARCRPLSFVSIAGLAALVALMGLVALTGTSVAVDTIALWPVIAVLTCVVIYASIRAAAPVTAALGSRFMVEVGKRSYGLYLWHFPIFVLVDTKLGLDTWGPRFLALAITAVVVPLSYRYIERPFLERKDARRPVPASAPTQAVPEPAAA